ncbi:MAG TPA: P-loop NTPase [Candidatus Sumerlaeota bacterium]|nr:P-loop NTPase [Candidatus Sumerlaeota bacterium]
MSVVLIQAQGGCSRGCEVFHSAGRGETGLEESEIRFFETVFSDYLSFTSLDPRKRFFNDDQIELLVRIRDLMQKRGFSIEEVKRELKACVRPGGAEKSGGARPAGYARVIAVTSGKGGVGKTTLVVNLAVALARIGKKVAIFDADLGLANVHILMGVKPRFNLSHLIQDGFSLEDVIATGPLGIQILSGGQGVRELANLREEERRALLRQIDRLERNVEFLLVDTGAGISENVLRFAAFADEIITVTTPNVAAASDAYSIIKILLGMEPRAKIGLVTNQVSSIYHSKNVFNRLNLAVEKYLNYSLGDLGYIVSDEYVMAANQQRIPLLLSMADAPSAQCIQAIARTILDDNVFVNTRKESSFQDLMGALRRTMAGAAV